jgi:hypothetical protein
VTGDLNHEVHAEIRDVGGEIVASVRVVWRLGLVPGASGQAAPPPRGST